MPRLFNINCATLPQQVALNRDNIQQLAEWLTNNPDIGNISVTTLAPGSQATATITRRYDEETDKAYIDVTLGIPQGATGATGATGPEGPKGDPGSDLFTDFTSVKIDTSAAHVSYSDGTAHITDATLIGYKSTGNEEVECAVDIPIVAGSGVTVDANDANNAIEVSATGGGGSGKYLHRIYCHYTGSANITDAKFYITFVTTGQGAQNPLVSITDVFDQLIAHGCDSVVNAYGVSGIINYDGTTTQPIISVYAESPQITMYTVNSRSTTTTTQMLPLSGWDITDTVKEIS